MATGTAPSSIYANRNEPMTAGEVVQAIVMPLASLRLTVALLSLAIFVTFIATLEQNWADVYDVKMRHFSSLIVSVPLQTFFVPAWFPEWQNVPGYFFMPSGFSILALLLINLTAAHVMRFRLQAKGGRLAIGLLLAVFAVGVTWAIIFNNQNSNGFQSRPPIPYESMWVLMQAGMLALTITTCGLMFTTTSKQRIERLLLAIGALFTGGILGVTVFLGESAFIGDSAMRVMWQMVQATIAACVAYAACLVLFQRKAGMVLLHLGVAGLMMNEIYVTVTNNEQRITVYEKETVSRAIDIRHTEMAVIDVSDPEVDQITTIPSSKLRSGNNISDDRLPFDLRCVKFLPASDVRSVKGFSDNLATSGAGLGLEAYEVPPVAGTDSEQVADLASAYVEILDKSNGDTLGTFLISQLTKVNANKVSVDGKEYFLALQFETEYKPYSIFLDKATRENYPGTMTPKYYGSQIMLRDFETNSESSQRIFMNEPLRYSDETFYQSGMDRDSAGRQYSVFQIVTNMGWMIPYVCCMFTVVGLVAQFGESLLGFLKKQRSTSRSQPQAVPTAELVTADDHERPSFIAGLTKWIPAGVLVMAFSVFAVYQYSKAYRPLENDGMRLDLLAKLPITFEGRVQPLGSFAVNTSRQIRERESLSDGMDKTQPAIRWVADVMFDAENSSDYRLFKIDDPNIINALGLPKAFPTEPKRKKYVYTFAELFPAGEKLQKLAPNPEVRKPKTWTQLERHYHNLKVKMQRVMGMRFTFGMELEKEKYSALSLIDAHEFATSALGYTPFLVPVDEDDQSWISYSQYQSRQFVQEYLEKYNCSTIADLSEKLHDAEVVPEVRKNMIIDSAIARLLSDFPELRKSMEEAYGEKDPIRLAGQLKERWNELPEEYRLSLEKFEQPVVDAMLRDQRPRTVSILQNDLIARNGNREETGLASVNVDTVSLLAKLAPAYRTGDADTFNSILEDHLAAFDASDAKGFSAKKLSTETVFNHLMPFYISMIAYLVAVIFALLSWIGYQSDWFRIAMARTAVCLLLFGLVMHFSGITMRVTISGRPPVTNLYSSALFVGMVGVGLLIICEWFTKLSICSALAGLGGFASLTWAYTMTITDGDTFTVMQAVLDTNFWLATHVVCISIGYGATFVAGLMGVGYVIAALLTPAFGSKPARKTFVNMLYGAVCLALLTSFFGTVLGGLWGDDSWGRFWGWDPKENGALMIVLANAVILHARWGGMVKERGLACLAILGNIIVLWSWKGVNAMGVGLHAYSATEDTTLMWIVYIGLGHIVLASIVLLPKAWWMSYSEDSPKVAKG